jgi:DNA-binding NarL/FixJ family response regulator
MFGMLLVEPAQSNGGHPNGSQLGCPRVLVVDRQALVVSALSRLLSGPPLYAEVIETTRSSAVVEIIEQTPVHVVVCEVKAQPVSGPELAAALARLHPTVKVILLIDSESESLLLAAFLSGAAGFLMKESPVEEFFAAVGTILQGQCVVGRGLLDRALTLLADRNGGRDEERKSQLSPAERGVLALLAQAHSIPSIAQAQGISPKTVRNHLAKVYRKLKVRNRAEAMLWAARMGLAPIGEL